MHPALRHFYYSSSRGGYYVRPSGSTYGTGDGSSYDNAWAGDAGIDWGSIPSGGTLYIAGAWSEPLNVQNSNVTISSLIADPCTIDGADILTECLVIDGKTNVTINDLTLIDATTSCADVRGASSGIVFNRVAASGSGNQAFQNQGACSVTYNDCTGSDSTDDGLSLHDTAAVVANRCTFSGNAQGVNGISTTVFIANDCTFTSNTTGAQNDSDADFTLNRCLFSSNATNNLNANSSVSMKANNCRFDGALCVSTSLGNLVISDSFFTGTSRVLSRGGATVWRSYFKSTQHGMVSTETSGSLTANYCVFYITTGTDIYALDANSTSAATLNNCTIAGQNNLGRGVDASNSGAVTLNNCILTDLSVGMVSAGATNVVTANFCDVFDVTTTAATFTSGTVTRNDEITTDPQIADAANDDFSTGANMEDVGTDTGITTGIGSASWGDSDSAPAVTTAEQVGTYNLGAYI